MCRGYMQLCGQLWIMHDILTLAACNMTLSVMDEQMCGIWPAVWLLLYAKFLLCVEKRTEGKADE